MKRAYFVCLFLCLTTTLLLSQSNHTNSVATSVAARECHKMLAGFADKDSTFFSTWEGPRSSDTLAEIEKCARESHDQLTRYDLAVAVVVTGWLNAKIKDDLFQAMWRENRDLQSKLDQLTKAKSSTSTPEIQIAIETLSSGFVVTLNIGGNQDRCTADGPESMICETVVPNLSYRRDTAFVAMWAKVKNSYGSTSYLIGCPPSVNCAPLVPGEYPASMSGNDGIVIAGLVREGKAEEAPHHGIYTILQTRFH